MGEDEKPDRDDEEFDATEWDAEDSDFDQSVDLDDEEFIRRNQVNSRLSIILYIHIILRDMMDRVFDGLLQNVQHSLLMAPV